MVGEIIALLMIRSRDQRYRIQDNEYVSKTQREASRTIKDI